MADVFHDLTIAQMIHESCVYHQATSVFHGSGEYTGHRPRAGTIYSPGHRVSQWMLISELCREDNSFVPSPDRDEGRESSGSLMRFGRLHWKPIVGNADPESRVSTTL
jgi:hypothetical protein